MNRDKLLLILTATGSALCWWPALIEQSLDFPRWILLVLVALIAGLSTALLPWKLWHVWVATVGGTFAGLFIGAALFTSDDPDGGAFALYLGTLLGSVVSLVAGLIGRRLPVSNHNHGRVVWLALLCCLLVGPLALAITPPIVGRRVARNDALAAARFQSLKDAAERTKANRDSRGHICDAEALRAHYSGPPFSEEDWQRMTENFAKKDYYAFRQDDYGFMVKCRESIGYTIDSGPVAFRGNANSKRRFCSDQCGESLRSQHLCSACSE